ncbi:zinc-dependent alcohol dehydrogenase [Nocardia salmonicida]|uniref:zinc-dependent alcohol dehydrogenase n=1 Tax=Nocardia salmonicida TaxID=53431 RepID=UPI0007A44AE6|nr:alcohol dehydrogenase catalytic domain-containing protein [Nocardia salmonicida]
MSIDRALVVTRPHHIELCDHSPLPPGYGQALIRVHSVGICGSDRELFDGTRPSDYVRYPVIPGHEWSGVVEAVGEGVGDHLLGRKVVGEGFRGCRRCDRCREGESTLCAGGYAETGFTVSGAMASTLTLPADLLHILSDEADLDAAALLEPAACAAAAALRCEVQPGDRVAVIGTGALGLLALQLLRASGPRELLAVGGYPQHAERALFFGATDFQAHETISTRGEFDIVLEAAGGRDSAVSAARLLRRGGRLVLTGIPATEAVGLDPTELVVRQLEVRTVFGAPSRAWTHAVRAFTVGILDPAPLITHKFALTEFETAMELVKAQDSTVGKVLLHPGRSGSDELVTISARERT